MQPKKKILIIEDEAPIRNLLVRQFTAHNLDVVTAPNGKVGLELAVVEHPDIILLDIILPIVDGLEFLRSLRRDVWGKSVHVVILTNLSDPKRIAEAKSLGVKEYIIKSGSDVSIVAGKIVDLISRAK